MITKKTSLTATMATASMMLGVVGCGSSAATRESVAIAAATTEVEALTTGESANTTEAPASTGLPLPSVDLSEVLWRGEPFQFSFTAVEDLPELPTAIDGYVAYEETDAAGLTGLVRNGTIRVFDADEGFFSLAEFSTQMNGCNEAFWVARWVVRNPDVRILATNQLDPLLGSGGYVDREPWLLPPEAPAGIMGASICTAPGFKFSSTVNGNESNLADVTVEWIYFDRDAVDTSPSDAPQCVDIAAKSAIDSGDASGTWQGEVVRAFQERLIDLGYGSSIESSGGADGQFGEGTLQAFYDYSNQLFIEGSADGRNLWSQVTATSESGDVPYGLSAEGLRVMGVDCHSEG